jgi:hypothetical protein
VGRRREIGGKNRSRSANARSGPTAIVPIDHQAIVPAGRPAIVLAGRRALGASLSEDARLAAALSRSDAARPANSGRRVRAGASRRDDRPPRLL